MRSSWVFTSGLATGAGLMLLLDPQAGARRRAVARDKMVRVSRKAGEAARTTARDVSNRFEGISAEVRALRARRNAPDDDVLVARVRSKLGRAVSHPHAIKVSAQNGNVIVEGPVLAHELDKAMAAVRRVRGVIHVESRLQAHDEPGSIPSLQGGAGRIGERYEFLQKSWSPAARLVATAAGGALALAAFSAMRRRPAGLGLTAIGGLLAARGATNLELKRLVGIGGGRRAIDLQKTIHVDAPVEEVFAFWRDYRNFPKFMRNVKEVRRTSHEGQSHWVVEGPGGTSVQFDAVVTAFAPNEVIAWRTTKSSPVGHAGIVRFDPTPEGGTRVHVRMSYNPPGGAIGAAVARLLGSDPKTQMDEDLARMKTYIETGRPARDAADPDHTLHERPTGTSGKERDSDSEGSA